MRRYTIAWGRKYLLHTSVSHPGVGWPTFGVRQALTLRTRGYLPSCPYYPRLSESWDVAIMAPLWVQGLPCSSPLEGSDQASVPPLGGSPPPRGEVLVRVGGEGGRLV